MSIHLICLQHVCRDAASQAGLSAIADPCFAGCMLFLMPNQQY